MNRNYKFYHSKGICFVSFAVSRPKAFGGALFNRNR